MARSSLVITLDQRTPVALKEGGTYGAQSGGGGTTKTGRQTLRKAIRQLEGVLGGALTGSHISVMVDGAQPIAASGTVAVLGSNNADTVSINGVAETATTLRASATLTLATAIAGNTVVIGGTTLTAVSGAPAANQFDISGGNTTGAASLVAAIQANATISGKILARSSAAVVTISAQTQGTSQNGIISIVTTGGTITIGGNASGGFLAGGANAATDQFDIQGSLIGQARSLALAINSSTTALVGKHCEACNFAGSITLTGFLAGNWLTILGHRFTAVAAAETTISNTQYGDFSISGTDTQDAAALVTQINAHPVLAHQVFASSASGVVTIRQRRGTTAAGTIQPGPGAIAAGMAITTQIQEVATVLLSAINEGNTGNAITLAESTGAARFTVSGARLTGGTGGETGTIQRLVIGAKS